VFCVSYKTFTEESVSVRQYVFLNSVMDGRTLILLNESPSHEPHNVKSYVEYMRPYSYCLVTVCIILRNHKMCHVSAD